MNRKGFTLVELLVVMAILGFLSAVLAMTFNIVTKIGVTAMEQTNILSQVEAAGRWISSDLENAIGTVDNTTGDTLCIIRQRSVWDNTLKQFVYTDNITYGVSNNNLMRTSQSAGKPTQTILVAQFIEPPSAGTTVFTCENVTTKYYNMIVKAGVGTSSIIRVYKMHQVRH